MGAGGGGVAVGQGPFAEQAQAGGLGDGLADDAAEQLHGGAQGLDRGGAVAEVEVGPAEGHQGVGGAVAVVERGEDGQGVAQGCQGAQRAPVRPLQGVEVAADGGPAVAVACVVDDAEGLAEGVLRLRRPPLGQPDDPERGLQLRLQGAVAARHGDAQRGLGVLGGVVGAVLVAGDGAQARDGQGQAQPVADLGGEVRGAAELRVGGGELVAVDVDLAEAAQQRRLAAAVPGGPGRGQGRLVAAVPGGEHGPVVVVGDHGRGQPPGGFGQTPVGRHGDGAQERRVLDVEPGRRVAHQVAHLLGGQDRGRLAAHPNRLVYIRSVARSARRSQVATSRDTAARRSASGSAATASAA
ncbi:hypothetical protein L6E12_22405 [Actinokineospora sp. PR83]|nr:hypothetical protein [Actinokineospora sp. PR83]MCG8918537.1 hypothetical protein [Actinokineospora sp. PR83]